MFNLSNYVYWFLGFTKLILFGGDFVSSFVFTVQLGEWRLGESTTVFFFMLGGYDL